MAQTPRACDIEKPEVDIRKALAKVIPLHGILLRAGVGIDTNDLSAPAYNTWADMIDIETFQKFLKGESDLKGQVTKLKKQLKEQNG